MQLVTTEEDTIYAKLIKLAHNINEAAANAEQNAEQTRKWGNSAIAEAVICGAHLIEAKKLVKHGQWLEWLKENCQKVTKRTANKYMALAKKNHGSYLNASTLKQAYIACGIIHVEQNTGTTNQSQLPVHGLFLKRFSSLNDKLQVEPIKTWPVDARAQLKEALRPIVAELGGTL